VTIQATTVPATPDQVEALAITSFTHRGAQRPFIHLHDDSRRRHGAHFVRVYQDRDGNHFVRRGNGRAYLTRLHVTILNGKPLTTVTASLGRSVRSGPKPTE
jgi:hypothetical protein